MTKQRGLLRPAPPTARRCPTRPPRTGDDRPQPIDREWKDGDKIQFDLPTVYKLTQYTGVDQIPGHDGKRFAVSVGPVVLACVALPTGRTLARAYQVEVSCRYQIDLAPHAVCARGLRFCPLLQAPPW